MTIVDSSKLFLPFLCFLVSGTGDPVTDHGLLNPTYLEALLWEGKRYQSLYLSPLGKMVDGAFIAPIASSICWFPNFSYEVTRRFIVAIMRILLMLRDFFRSILQSLLNREQDDDYEPVPSIKI